MTRQHRVFALPISVRAGLLAAVATAAIVGLREIAAPWWLCVATLLLAALCIHWYIRSRIAFSLRTAGTIIGAIRSGDFLSRARRAGVADPIGELLGELNELAEQMRRQHLVTEEISALLQTIVAQTEISLLAFDQDDVLKWANPAAERLFSCQLGTSAKEVGLDSWFTIPSGSIVSIPGQPLESSWQLRRGSFWQDRKRYTFFLVSEATRARREHERIAWKALIRVIGHEVNNTLAPIQSLAGTALAILREDGPKAAVDLLEPLSLIEQRAGSLQRFIADYARVAKLPSPQLTKARLHECVRASVELGTRGVVEIIGGPDLSIEVDVAQLEQALVNVVKNAVEAVQVTGGGVSVSWSCVNEDVVIVVSDEGTGIDNPANLFVPFFSTKSGGSGIGLVLSRNIIENHGGELTIVNRRERTGCIVRIRLPIAASRRAPTVQANH